MEAACVSELGIEASELRGQEDVPRLEGEALSEEDEACRGLKQKLEAMGPVNMMALEEYTGDLGTSCISRNPAQRPARLD